MLVGASMGGGTSLVAAGERHVDATALVLVDIAPSIESEGVKNIQAFMSLKPEGFDSLEEVAHAIGTYQPHRRRPSNLEGLAKNVRLGADGRYHWHWDPLFRAGTRNLEQRTHRLETCAANLDLPTLLVRGGLSDLLSEQGAQAFLKLCPTAEYVSVTGAGHMVAGDRTTSSPRSSTNFSHGSYPFMASRCAHQDRPGRIGTTRTGHHRRAMIALGSLGGWAAVGRLRAHFLAQGPGIKLLWR